MDTEETILVKYIRDRGLRLTPQRELILKEFLSEERHMTVDDLYAMVSRRHPGIGHTTVFRTLKLFEEARLARKIDLGDQCARFEHEFGHRTTIILCVLFVAAYRSVCEPRIEKLQEELCRMHGFQPERHRLEIFGSCASCREKKRKRE